MKRLILILILYLAPVILVGQNFFPILGGQRIGTSVFSFLKIGVSAHSVAMGEAVVAVQQDASSMYYNPASIAQFQKNEFSASRINWPADVYYDYFAFSGHLFGRHYLGISAGILHMEPMMETTEYYPHGTGNYFVFQDQFIGIVYSAKMTDQFSFGVTVKYVEENLAGYKMSQPLLDMGTFYWTGFQSLRFSASISHFGAQTRPEGTFQKRYLDKTTGKEETESAAFEEFSPPTVFRVGAAMNVIDRKYQKLLLAVQLNHPVDNAENISTGLEYSLFDVFFIRGGYKINREEENVSFGGGLEIPVGGFTLKIDYSYSNFVHLSDPVRYSIGFSF